MAESSEGDKSGAVEDRVPLFNVVILDENVTQVYITQSKSNSLHRVNESIQLKKIPAARLKGALFPRIAPFPPPLYTEVTGPAWRRRRRVAKHPGGSCWIASAYLRMHKGKRTRDKGQETPIRGEVACNVDAVDCSMKFVFKIAMNK